ncbi:MAG: sigma-70 family RNA polymerase sigma factor [Burkholderiaceae bacterium]|nr:sigma-70 family RNA polymerase sigma factor [Burkholderiaceae bacterium]
MPQATTASVPVSTVPCLTQAWAQHHAVLLRWLVHRLSDVATAQDLLQDVFLKALRQGERFCSVGNARAWLFEVARNTLTDHLRRQHPTEPLPQDLEEWPAADAEALPVVDQLTGCLARVLTELPEADADILRYCDLQGMRQPDYASLRGLGLPAVKARLRRARLRLKARMTEACAIQAGAQGGVEAFTPRSSR